MKVRDIETMAPEVIGPDETIEEAAKKMRQLDIGMMPVCDGERLCGAITDRDVTIRCVAEGRDPKSTFIRACMTSRIIYCFEDQNVKEVAKLMEEQQVRRLPVLNKDKRLVGIISLGDLAVRTGKEKLAGEILERVSEPVRGEPVLAG